jgi:CRP/FNR family transcriptional regulator
MEHQLRSQTSDELAIAQDQMLLLGRKTAKERVASFLLQLSTRAKRLGQPGNPIVLTMGRADMGDYLGLTIETVSRTFTKLRAEKLITLGAGNAVRLDIERLEEVAGAWG